MISIPCLPPALFARNPRFRRTPSSPKNAIGLMQVLPKTGKLLGQALKVRYTKNKLFEPDFNIELGMVYIAGLVRQTGALEYAAAAYKRRRRPHRGLESRAQLRRDPGTRRVPFLSRKPANMCKSSCATRPVYRMIYRVAERGHASFHRARALTNCPILLSFLVGA